MTARLNVSLPRNEVQNDNARSTTADHHYFGRPEPALHCEMNMTLARATFLDPRFKKIGFNSEVAFNKAREKAQNAIANELCDRDQSCQINTFNARFSIVSMDSIFF